MAVMTRKQALFFNMFQANKRRKFMMFTTLASVIARRKKILKVCSIILLLSISASRNCTTIHRHRSCRRFLRNVGWWNLVWNTHSESRFKKTFRVSRTTFLYILRHVRPHIEREFIIEEPISAEQRLGICLYRLGRGDYLHTLAEMSGLGVSTVRVIISEVSRAIVNILWTTSVVSNMPKIPEEFKANMAHMEEMWQFPCCWSAMDGSHLPIKCPPGGLESCKEYHNYKNFYSVVLMALVDSSNRFVWASCGYPGNSHDAIILQSTDLWRQMENDYIPQIAKEIHGVNVGPQILGDSAFPLKKWLMKPYTNAALTEKQKYFNYRLSRARMVTERAFGHLKGRWRVLMRKCESSTEEVKQMALACIVLHNICIEHGDVIPRKLDLTRDPYTNETRDSEEVRKTLQMRSCSKTKDTSARVGNEVREALARKLWLEKETGIVV